MVNLSKRMLMNVGLLPVGKRIADIGCDHGWVSIYLVQNNLATHVIAMDVAEGPLIHAREHIHNANLDDKIEVRLSDGLDALQFDANSGLEVDAVLIAGMGGHLAIRLLEENILKCRMLNCFVLQIQSDIEFVRKRIAELGFFIDDEQMVYEDGKFYVAMRICISRDDTIIDYDEGELRYGPVLLKKKDEVLLAFLKKKKADYTKILESITNNSGGIEANDRTEKINYEIDLIGKCMEKMGYAFE